MANQRGSSEVTVFELFKLNPHLIHEQIERLMSYLASFVNFLQLLLVCSAAVKLNTHLYDVFWGGSAGVVSRLPRAPPLVEVMEAFTPSQTPRNICRWVVVSSEV